MPCDLRNLGLKQAIPKTKDYCTTITDNLVQYDPSAFGKILNANSKDITATGKEIVIKSINDMIENNSWKNLQSIVTNIKTRKGSPSLIDLTKVKEKFISYISSTSKKEEFSEFSPLAMHLTLKGLESNSFTDQDFESLLPLYQDKAIVELSKLLQKVNPKLLSRLVETLQKNKDPHTIQAAIYLSEHFEDYKELILSVWNDFKPEKVLPKSEFELVKNLSEKLLENETENNKKAEFIKKLIDIQFLALTAPYGWLENDNSRDQLIKEITYSTKKWLELINNPPEKDLKEFISKLITGIKKTKSWRYEKLHFIIEIKDPLKEIWKNEEIVKDFFLDNKFNDFWWNKDINKIFNTLYSYDDDKYN